MRGDSDSVQDYMPLFLGDYRRDTTDLTCIEHGAYIQLLTELWSSDGYLAYDPARLAMRISLPLARWEAVWKVIGRFFDVFEGRISQKRLLYELTQAKEKRQKRSKAGANGATARWQTHSNRIATASPNGCDGNSKPMASEPEPEPEPEKIQIKDPGPAAPASGPKYSDAFQSCWIRYGRKEEKEKAYAQWKIQAKQLSGGEAELRELILAALVWQGPIWHAEAWKYAKFFERYLKARKWKDEPPPRIAGLAIAAPVYCAFHSRGGSANKAAAKHDTTCPECRHVAARTLDRVGEPTAVGALGDELPGWGR